MGTRGHRVRPFALLAVTTALFVGTLQAAVVTQRLGTGLSSSASTATLPEAWVAAVESVPKIDGQLREEAWTKARPIVLGRLTDRREASPRSEIRLIRRDRVLYVGATLNEPDIDALKRTVSQRDGSAYQDDSVELFLSPDLSQGYYQLIFGAGGAVFDRHGHGNPAAWNSGATAAVAVGADGWSLEASIPMSALGINQQMPKRWRANFYRNRRAGRRSESQAFSPPLRPDYDVPERFGHLLLTPAPPQVPQEATREDPGIEVVQLDNGQAVLKFDLSSLPKDAQVYRARLRCARSPIDPADHEPPGPIEILPVAEPYQEGRPPRATGRPLALVGPWYDSFDATDVVRAWRAGRAAPELFIKTFAKWLPEGTYLDVAYEGRPEDIPPQVTGLAAFHRAGQTLLTWQEIDDPVGNDEIRWEELRRMLDKLDREREIRYCVYRAARPITSENLHEAEQIAVVRPLSCFNINGRNVARAIDEFIATADGLRWHQWNPFRNASIDGDFGRDCPIDRFVIAEGKGPLPRRTGLYVHTADADESAYYAVVTRIDGIENTTAIGPGNALARPIAETVAAPEPVLQGELAKMPFFNYDQRRLHFVRWVGPPYSNRPSDYYNWSVGVPNELTDGAALELNLHRDGRAYWRTHYRIEPGSIVLCPHDFPRKSWWYGYHEACDNLQPWAGGTIRNYTEKRLLWFVDWAARRWKVDRNRILATGCDGGASGGGALHLGLRYPEIFNLVIAGHGEADYRGLGEEVVPVWGKQDWALKTETGQSVWDELDLVQHVRRLPPIAELPLVTMTYSDKQPTAGPLAEALIAARRPVLTYTSWGGTRYLAVSANSTGRAVRLDVRKDRSMLAVGATGTTGDAVRNGSLRWTVDELVDQPKRYAVTLVQEGRAFDGTITLWRLQQFRVRPGMNYLWQLDPTEPVVAGRRNAPQPQDGQVVVGSDGLLTVPLANVAAGTYRLSITPK